MEGWQGKDIFEVYRQYYEAVEQAAQTGFYDFIGHFDVIKRFGYKPERDTWQLEKSALDTIREQGLAIELNASGLRMPCAEMFPSDRILRYCFEQGIPLTIGLDLD